MMGIDRSNPSISEFFCPVHPSLIRMIKMVALEAKRQNKPVTICGEIASNPLLIPLLLGLGFSEFSCAPRHVPLVKKAIRQCYFSDACEVAHQALQMSSSTEIAKFLLQQDKKDGVKI